jgi:hypothetical protein
VIEIAGQLRRSHRRVAQQTVKSSEQELCARALAAGQAQGAAALIVVGAPGMDHEHVAMFDGLRSQRKDHPNGTVHRPLMKKLTLSALMTLAGRSRRRGKESS